MMFDDILQNNIILIYICYIPFCASGDELIQEMVQWPATRIRAFQLSYITSKSEIRNILIQIRHLVITNIVVVASRPLTNDILDQVKMSFVTVIIHFDLNLLQLSTPEHKIIQLYSSKYGLLQKTNLKLIFVSTDDNINTIYKII